MKTLTKNLSLMLLAIFFLASCISADNKEKKEGKEATKDEASENADIAKLSDISKNELDKVSKAGCECLKNHGSELKTFLDEVKPLLAEAKNSKEPMEVMSKAGDSMIKMNNFGECMNKADTGETEETKKAIDEDLVKILGENPEPEVKQKKQMEILNAYFGKNCPNEGKLFTDFIKFGEEMEALAKNK